MGTRTRRRVRGFRRTRATAAASALGLALTVLLAPAGDAQEPPAQTPPETGEINNGTAKAIAGIASISPGVGNLALSIGTGTAVTQVTNALAQATSQAADLGLIGSALTAEGCSNAVLTPEDLPQPLAVDNRAGDAHETRAEGGDAGSPAALGTMDVRAAQDAPASTARTTLAGLGLPGLGGLDAGRAEATTRVLPGEGREAVAAVTSALQLGPLELEGLRWDAVHRTGVEPHAEGSFQVGTASVGGVPIATDDLHELQGALNTALEPTGVTLRFPEVQRVLDPDFLRVTPLVVELRDSELGKTLLGPVLDATRAQRTQLFDDLTALVCEMASVLLVGDVAVSVLGGTGFLTIAIGGVEVSSADLEVGNPFGDFPGPAGGAPATPQVAGGADTGPAVGVGGGTLPSTSPPSTVAAGTPAQQPQARPARATGAIEELCESLHPNRSPCSEGAAATVGALGLLATAGVAGADVVRQRRRALAGEV